MAAGAAAALTAAIEAQVARANARSVLIGFSGGLDSSTLLACAARSEALRALPMAAVHVHHGLHSDADQWAEQAQSFAASCHVPLQVVRVHVDPRGMGIEAAARAARYQAFESLLAADGILLLAHHQQDQAETVLLRLLRGAGLDGVAAMRALRPLGPAWLGRPWLDQPRASLQAAARELSLSWVEDPANSDQSMDRAWLRTDVWPTLLQRFPEGAARLARFAAHARTLQAVIHDATAGALDQVRASQACCLRIDALLQLPEGLIGEVLRAHAIEQGALPPGFHELARIRREVIGARADAEPCMGWHDHEYRRYRNDLYLLRRSQTVPGPDLTLLWPEGEATLNLPAGLGQLRAQDADGAAQPLPCALTVRFGVRGARLRPAGSAHTRELRAVYQLQGVPPWQRLRLPMLYCDDELLAVPGIVQSNRYSAHLGELQLHWLH